MSRLDPDLAAALEALAELGPLQVLDIQPTPPRPEAPTATAAPGPQPSLFDPKEAAHPYHCRPVRPHPAAPALA
jgi:hypothetical protein